MLGFTVYVFCLSVLFCMHVETDGVLLFVFKMILIYVGIDGVLFSGFFLSPF